MQKKIIRATIQLHRGYAATWAAHNPTLAYGEPGYEKDTGRLKIGDGETEWNLLPYFDHSFAKISRNNENDYESNFIAPEYQLCFVDTLTQGLRVKLGDGITQWENLPYLDEHIYEELEQKVNVSYDANEEMLIFSA